MDNIRKLSETNGVKVVEADVDEAPAMSNAVEVKAMPTFQMWKPDKATGKLGLDKANSVVVGATRRPSRRWSPRQAESHARPAGMESASAARPKPPPDPSTRRKVPDPGHAMSGSTAAPHR